MTILIEWVVRLMVWLSRWAPQLSRCGIIHYGKWQPGQKMKILLVGYNGARNTGADARVVALVQQLLEATHNHGKGGGGSSPLLVEGSGVVLTVMTLNPDNVKGYFPDCVNILPFPTFFCWPLFRAASAHHAAILCEGSTLTHTFADALSMFFCQAAGIMKRQGKPCIAYGSDVSPLLLREGSGEGLFRLAQQMCSDVYFIARSQPSLNTLQSMGFRCHLGTDTAWTFKVPEHLDNGKEMIMTQGWDGNKPLLGVAVINPYCWPVKPSLRRWIKATLTGNHDLQYDKMFFFRDSKERRNKYRNYLTQMAEAVKSYKLTHDAFVVIIGMEKLDAKACGDFKELIGEDCAMITSAETPVFQMTSVLHCLDALVTSRYHAAVLSMQKGMPIVAVSMDNRLDGLFHDINLEDKYLHHVGDSDLSNRITRSLAEAEHNKDRILETISTHVIQYRSQLKDMSEFLNKFLNY